ncbi:MAG: hypothetical protein IPN71_23585 [Fibrobacteres bacterium]|jgi:hypothetical protein|nr:hypothetical protein [Fibrobacterota bacterium]
MRYWKVSLLHQGRTAREWHVRAEVLTVGSHGSNTVRLPPPVEAFALRFEDLPETPTVQIGDFLLKIEDETRLRKALVNRAQQRFDQADLLVAAELPREAHSPARILITAFTLAGLTHLTATFLGSQSSSEEPRATRHAIQRVSHLSAATSEPSYSSLSKSAQAPVSEILSVVHSPDESPLMIALVPTGTFHSMHQNPSSDGFAVPSLESVLAAAPDERWTSQPPERYQAPWPDAPVPPH